MNKVLFFCLFFGNVILASSATTNSGATSVQLASVPNPTASQSDLKHSNEKQEKEWHETFEMEVTKNVITFSWHDINQYFIEETDNGFDGRTYKGTMLKPKETVRRPCLHTDKGFQMFLNAKKAVVPLLKSGRSDTCRRFTISVDKDDMLKQTNLQLHTLAFIAKEMFK